MTFDTLNLVLALAALAFGYWQWRKVRRSPTSVTGINDAAARLPAWFTERMMGDDWMFGLHMNDGSTLPIRKITALTSDIQWMDVELMTTLEVPVDCQNDRMVYAVAGDRTSASVQINKVVFAYEFGKS